MNITVRTSYRNDVSSWLRGNLHAHTLLSDGCLSPQETVDAYAARGYDFLVLSDHDMLTDVKGLDSRGMTLIPGNEITEYGPHLLHVGAKTCIPPDRDRQKVIDAIRAENGVAILNHPAWERHFNHCPIERLESLQRYDGIEIYNGVVRRADGNPLTTDRWDRMLSGGRHCWGYANDDCHERSDFGVAWNVAQSMDRDPESIVAALREGRCYASTGVTITSIGVHGRHIAVETRNADSIAAITNWGWRAQTFEGPAATFRVPDEFAVDMTYVRFECFGRGESMAWTQPFFIDKEETASAAS